MMWEKLTSGVYTIAEMSANHSGSLEHAINTVKAAKASGADCVKVQTYTEDTLTIDCKNEYFKVKDGLWEDTYLYDLYKGASLPWEWHRPIQEECEKQGIDFLSTPFDTTAVDFLEELGVNFYKIASFELVDVPLIEYTASKGKPMIISTGMGTQEDIQDALDACDRAGNKQIILLRCISEYPTDYKTMDLATIEDMKERFHVPIGLSDHSMGWIAPVVATSMGATVIEKHFCLHRSIPSADAAFSMEPHEFKEMTEKVKLAREVRGEVNYDLSEKSKSSLAFRRSLFVVKDIKEGELFTAENIRSIRPGYGDKPKFFCDYLGRKAAKDLKRGTPLLKEYINE